MERKRVISYIVGIVFLICVGYGFGVNSVYAEKVTLEAWHCEGPDYTEFYYDLLKTFNKTHPNIKVVFNSQVQDTVIQKYAAAVITHTLPDMSMHDTNYEFPVEVRFHIYQDLSPYLEKDPELKKIVQVMDPTIMEAFYFGDKLIGLPTAGQKCSRFIRKSWMEKFGLAPPEDWNELLHAAQLFTFNDPDENGKDDTYGYYEGLRDAGHWEYLPIAAEKYPWITPDGKPSFMREGVIQATRWLHEGLYKHKVIPLQCLNAGYAELYAAVPSKKIGIGRVGSWNIKDFDEWMDKDYVVFEMPPRTKDQKEPNWQFTSSHGICLFKTSEHKKEAVEWMKFFVSIEAQVRFYQATGMMGVRRDMPWDELIDNPRAGFFVKPHSWVQQPKWLPEWLPVRNALVPHLNKIFADPNADIETEFEAAYKEALEAIKEIK